MITVLWIVIAVLMLALGYRIGIATLTKAMMEEINKQVEENKKLLLKKRKEKQEFDEDFAKKLKETEETIKRISNEAQGYRRG